MGLTRDRVPPAGYDAYAQTPRLRGGRRRPAQRRLILKTSETPFDTLPAPSVTEKVAL